MTRRLDLRCALSLAPVYRSFQRLVGGNIRESLARDWLRMRPGQRLLDIGCGPAEIVSYLPTGVEYVGLDESRRYVESARRRYGDRGQFHCLRVDDAALPIFGKFDCVLALAIVHHLDDSEATRLFQLASASLRAGGRLLTLDGCFVDGQSPTARRLLSWDRGQHVRTQQQYLSLACQVFPTIEAEIRHDLLRIPYTHILLQCQAPDRSCQRR